MRACTALAIMVVLISSAAGCSRNDPSGPGDQDQRQGGTKPSAGGNQADGHDESAANAKLANTVSVAEIYFRHADYDEAEKTLREALADPAATDRAAAIALLDKILLKRREVSTPQAHFPPMDIPQAEASEVAAGSQQETTASAEGAGPGPLPPVDETADTDTASNQEAPAPERSAGEPVANTSRPPPKKIEKVPAEDRAITEVVQESTGVASPGDALESWDDFIARHTLTAEQQKRIDAQLKIWRERSEKEMVRSGTAWVTPQEAKAAADRASEYITGALTALEQSEFRKAEGMLKRASTADPGGIRADFILGMLRSIRGMNDPTVAKMHFRTVLARSPDNIAALNNIALAEVKLREFGDAYSHWKRAVQVAPTNRETIQNLGRIVNELQKGKIAVREEWVSRFQDLYREAIASAGGQKWDASVGWLYVSQVLPEVEDEAEEERRKAEEKPVEAPKLDAPLVAFGSGSGFVIHGEYILTNRHVIHDERHGVADAVRIIDPADPAHLRVFDATLVAMSNEHDIALVKCPGLKAPAVPLARELPERGSDVMVLGYPQSDLFGKNLKTTRGTVTALPDPTTPLSALRNMLVFDAEANSGNSGGPVCNQYGQAVAVLTVKTSRSLIGQYTAGVPSADAIPFLQRHLADYRVPEEHTSTLEWPKVDAKVSPSTILIETYYRGVPFVFDFEDKLQRAALSTRSPFEDPSCSICNGRGGLPCPTDRCAKGVLTVMVPYRHVQRAGDREIVTTLPRSVKKPCPTCKATGAVDCPFCTDGIDPTLVRR